MQRSVYILIMLLFVGNYAAWGNPVNFASTRYGLTFRSHTVNQDERTSLDLSPEESFNLKSGFSMSFDLKLFEANLTYGYVFRIIFPVINCLIIFQLPCHNYLFYVEKYNYCNPLCCC